MPCSSCGSSDSTGSCSRCSQASAASGGTFDAWGSSSAEWEKALPAWNGPPAATASVTVPTAGWTTGGAVATVPSWSSAQAKAEPETDGWGEIAAVPTPMFAPQPAAHLSDQPDGWNRTPLPPSKAQPVPIEEEEEEGWLGSSRTATVGQSDRLQPVKPVVPAWDDEEIEEDSWLDADDEIDPQLVPGSPAEGLHPGGGGLLWVAAAIVVVLIGLGAYTVKKPASVPTAAATAGERASRSANESLQTGRSFVESGKTFLKSDGEAAAIQFAAAISALKAGGAAPTEIQQVRKLQARAQVKAGKHEEAHQTWSSLLKVPALKAEANKGVKQASRDLRIIAAAKLGDAEGALKAHEFKRAETLARESAKLFEKYAGSDEQVGMAYGALGIAESKLGKVSSAREHLGWALGLAPRAPYRVAFDAVNPSGEAFDPRPEPAAVAVQAPPQSFSIDDESTVPKGTVGVGVPSQGQPSATITTVQSSPIQTQKTGGQTGGAKTGAGKTGGQKENSEKPGAANVLKTYNSNGKPPR